MQYRKLFISRGWLLIGLLLIGLISAGLGGCGGGGGSSNSPGPIPVAPSAEELLVSDSQPRVDVTVVDPASNDLFLAHLGFSDLTVSYTGDCTSGVAVRHAVQDLNDAQFDQLLDHKIVCPPLADNSSYQLEVEMEAADGDDFTTPLAFSTGVAETVGLTVMDTVTSPRATVQNAAADYIANNLVDDLNLPNPVDSVLTDALLAIFAGWSNLSDPGAIYGVTRQRVRYLSRQPDGNVSSDLSGLVAMPDTSGAFTPREQIILLSHATGSTPSDLQPGNAWVLLANILASYGYLVVAPDNWGRGATSAQPETYLMANRTGANSLDMLRRVLADSQYDDFRNTTAPARVIIVGYSQGGHSALATWQAAVTQAATDVVIDQVYAGGGPYNVYQTFRGVMQHLQGSCADTDYCRFVDDETTVPFATNRVLPGFVEYTDTGLTLASLVNGDSLATDFVDGFLDNEAQYDALKAMLQQSSFTNVENPAEAWGGSSTAFTLYHSEFDRLVPQANSNELATLFDGQQTLDYRDGLCGSAGYQALFTLTTGIVGVVHSVCGLSMIDEVIAELR